MNIGFVDFIIRKYEDFYLKPLETMTDPKKKEIIL
jgi:hypothetical protein